MRYRDIYQFGAIKYYQLSHPYIFVVQGRNLDDCHYIDSEILNTLTGHDFKMTLSAKTLDACDIFQKYVYTARKCELFDYFNKFDDHIEMLRPDLFFTAGNKTLQSGMLDELFKMANTYPKRVIMLDDMNGVFLQKLASDFPEYYAKLPKNNVFTADDIDALNEYYAQLNRYYLNFTLEKNHMSFTEQGLFE